MSDTSDDEAEDRYVDLEEDLANVIADVHDLGALSLLRRFLLRHTDGLGNTGHFSHLNYTGFIKIVKKHDVNFPSPRSSASPPCSPSLLSRRNGRASSSRDSSCATSSRSAPSTRKTTMPSSSSSLVSTTSFALVVTPSWETRVPGVTRRLS